MQRHKVFEIELDDLSDFELDQKLVSFLNSESNNIIATPNAEMLLDVRHDDCFGNALKNTDLNIPDSTAMRFTVSALTDEKLKYRHTGVDTLERLIKICQKEEKTILLFGADEDVLEKAKKYFLNKYSSINVKTLDPGFLMLKSGWIYVRDEVIDEINNLKPDVIAVALSHKKQLFFMNQFKDQLIDVKIMIGIGGALDMFSGKYRRAPRFMQKIGLEWVWRVLIEPSRIDRILSASIKFPLYVMSEAIKSKRLIKAVLNTFPEIARQLIGK